MAAENKRPVEETFNPNDNSTTRPRKRVTVLGASDDPAKYALSVFEAHGLDPTNVKMEADSKFKTPSPEMIEAYTMETSEAVRRDDLGKLKKLHESGALLDCCNRFGDSLVHIACRRGFTRIVKFLIEDAQVSVNMKDEQLRTPLHDACWTSEPNFEIVELLLRKAPEHALLPDIRGFTPFNYCRKSHFQKWVKFLSDRQSLLRPKELRH